jgi:hypothetical protein
MIATRIARRLMRKIAKPVVLLWTNCEIRRTQNELHYFDRVLRGLVPNDLRQELVELIAKRNRIQSW